MRCPTCGEVAVVGADEGTPFYLPVKQGADGDAVNMAISIRFALSVLGEPEDEPDPQRATALGALSGALLAHDRRMAGS